MVLVPSSRHLAKSVPEGGQPTQVGSGLELKKCAKAPEKCGAVFALFRLLALSEMNVLNNTFGLHFSLCQSRAQPIEALGCLPNHFGHGRLANLQNVAICRRAN